MVRSKRRSPLVTSLPLILSVLSFAGFGLHLLFNSAPSDPTVNTGSSEVESVQVSENSTSQHSLQSSEQSFPTLIDYPEKLKQPDSAVYPNYTNLLDVIKAWNPDDPEPPSPFRESLQHFNFSNPDEMDAALKFRDAELPFKVFNVPEFDSVVDKWTDDYLILQYRNSIESRRVEKSKSNHFMYWNANQRLQIKNYKPPTEIVSNMQFETWLHMALHADTVKVKNETVHYYFMSNALPGVKKSSFISRDLPLFSSLENNFFISNVVANKGIQCRFGMRGVIAEAHYDSGRNMVAMLKGAKRYILNPPHESKKLGLITEQRHPSYRHSSIDWSDVSQATSNGFANVNAIDTIVRQGEVLYIPSYWFHYIVSLNYSVQCNSRSGSPPKREGQDHIEQCLGDKLNLRK